MQEWVRTKVQAWAHGVRTLAKIANQYPQLAIAGLGMLLQLEWKYLQRTVPEVGTLMDPIKDTLIEDFFPALFGGEEISANLREILGQSVKRGGLGIPDIQISAERAYNTSKSVSEVLVVSLLGGIDFNYIAHKGCVRRASADGQKQWEFLEKGVPTRQHDLVDGAGLNPLWQATDNGA